MYFWNKSAAWTQRVTSCSDWLQNNNYIFDLVCFFSFASLILFWLMWMISIWWCHRYRRILVDSMRIFWCTNGHNRYSSRRRSNSCYQFRLTSVSVVRFAVLALMYWVHQSQPTRLLDFCSELQLNGYCCEWTTMVRWKWAQKLTWMISIRWCRRYRRISVDSMQMFWCTNEKSRCSIGQLIGRFPFVANSTSTDYSIDLVHSPRTRWICTQNQRN